MDFKFDAQHIWHPYTSMRSSIELYGVKSASGTAIELDSGQVLVDGMSSWWAAIHGYNHPVLNAAAIKQLNLVSHIMFGGLTHKPAIELAKLLVNITPSGLDTVFFSDSGSVAIEIAIKMALQYWLGKQKKHKNKLLTITCGYHGDTFAAMSVCDPQAGMHHLFTPLLTQHYFAPAPHNNFKQFKAEDLAAIQEIVAQEHLNLAAIILEPIVQGAGGMRFYSPEYLLGVRNLCDEYDLLLIADEIATGFGRTGKLFACEHAAISPDIMCVGKALTGGYLTLAASLTTSKVVAGITQGSANVLMHGPTFMANPLACAVACASIKLLLSYNWQEKIERIETQLTAELSLCNSLPQVKKVRILGAIGVVELYSELDLNYIVPLIVAEGIWLRPFRNLIYLMPPYIIKEQDLSLLTTKIYQIIKNHIL